MDHPSRDLDACSIMGIHQRFATNVRDLGVAFAITGDLRYARKAREILVAYVESYLTYSMHTTNGEPTPEGGIGAARVGPQTLDEAVWIIPICQGADLVWDSLTDDDRQAITQRLLLPSAHDVLATHPFGIHNIQCWKNSAIGLIGLLLGDDELVETAIDDSEIGTSRQLRDGVLESGMWWEGAWSHHFYTLSSLWPLAVAADNCSIGLAGPELKKMFDAPISAAMPDLVLPAFNDSGKIDVGAQSALYELAFARFGEPSYTKIIARSDRVNDMAMLFGAETIPETEPHSAASSNDADAGYAVLASGDAESTIWTCLKYGPHGGGHGHPDKMGLVIYAAGEVIADDPGMAPYWAPIHGGWYRTTVAHNTLVVDQTSQQPAEGSALYFQEGRNRATVMADSGPIYDGTNFVRTVFVLANQLIVVLDQVEADRERTMDIVFHHRGEWTSRTDGTPWTPPDIDGYRYIKDSVTHHTANDSTFEIASANGKRIVTTLAGGESTELITATGIGDHIDDRVPMVIARRKTKETIFGWCIAIDSSPAHITWLPVRDEKDRMVPSSVAVAAEVATLDEKRWELLVNPTGLSVSVTLPDDPRWRTDAICKIR